MKSKRNAKIIELSATMIYAQIAKKLGISRQTVARVVFRAKPGATKRHRIERAAHRRWYLKNRNKILSRYHEDPHVRARVKAASRRWYLKNRHKILRKAHARRAEKAAA